ncbi:MAG: hypothetical protein DRO06_02570 [Thermoproteota archaeon]|nr:MAG: hypothetical protein DRO06_02570 [Candidatus Korarchaeota archaeon]
MRREFLIAGAGGQGVVTAGRILAEALFLEGYYVVFTRSYGSEARTGYTRAEVVATEGFAYDMGVREPDSSLIMTRSAWRRWGGRLRSGGVLVADRRVEGVLDRHDLLIVTLPLLKVGEELGAAFLGTAAGLGALSEVCGLPSVDSLLRASGRVLGERAGPTREAIVRGSRLARER